MTDIINHQSPLKRAGVRGRKQASPKTDMTPMVDLGFLLISFFIFTSQLSEPKGLDLFMPKGEADMPVAKSSALTILLGKNNTVFYYHGKWADAFAGGRVVKTDFSPHNGIGRIIREQQIFLDGHKVNDEGRKGLMVMIKPTRDASYKNVVDALDEMMIHTVTKYTITNVEASEYAYVSMAAQ